VHASQYIVEVTIPFFLPEESTLSNFTIDLLYSKPVPCPIELFNLDLCPNCKYPSTYCDHHKPITRTDSKFIFTEVSEKCNKSEFSKRVLKYSVHLYTPKSGSQIGVPKQGPKSGSRIRVQNRGPKSGSQMGVPNGGPKWGSQMGVPNGSPKWGSKSGSHIGVPYHPLS
jgi:hypothetical protein